MARDTSTRQADHELVCELAEIASRESKKERSVKSTTYEVPIGSVDGDGGGDVMEVQSWKMREWDYFKVPPPFPTLARGLFTTKYVLSNKSGKEEERYRIVARGYDKFFNIGEVPWTLVSNAFQFT